MAMAEGTSDSNYAPYPPHGLQGLSHFSPTRGDTAGYTVHESEADELDQQGPPKKKRRRQALSCTGNLSSLQLKIR